MTVAVRAFESLKQLRRGAAFNLQRSFSFLNGLNG
jgi:hypothetical protein